MASCHSRIYQESSALWSVILLKTGSTFDELKTECNTTILVECWHLSLTRRTITLFTIDFSSLRVNSWLRNWKMRPGESVVGLGNIVATDMLERKSDLRLLRYSWKQLVTRWAYVSDQCLNERGQSEVIIPSFELINDLEQNPSIHATTEQKVENNSVGHLLVFIDVR